MTHDLTKMGNEELLDRMLTIRTAAVDLSGRWDAASLDAVRAELLRRLDASSIPTCPQCGSGTLEILADRQGLRVGCLPEGPVTLKSWSHYFKIDAVHDFAQFFRLRADSDGWVSVDVQKPQIGEWQWVVCNGHVQRMAAYLSLKGFAGEDGMEWIWADESADPAPFEAVTHYRTLPQPPKKG